MRKEVVMAAAFNAIVKSEPAKSGGSRALSARGDTALPITGLNGLQDKPRLGKKPLYGEATNKRILALLDRPPPGYARGAGPLLAEALGDVGVNRPGFAGGSNS
jgi:hypothetical protein